MKIYNYIEQGGAIMYVLLLLNIVGVAIMLYKFFELTKEKKKTDQTATYLEKALGLSETNKHTSAIVELSKKELSSYMGKLERGLNTVKIIAAISPLIGLLGTVLGVLLAFKVMSQSGLNNPTNFAEGISLALITTVGGLIVAIPHYIGHNYLIGILDELEIKNEKKLLTKVL